jgi:hypothetical protein
MPPKGQKRKRNEPIGAPGTHDAHFKSWMISVIGKTIWGGKATATSRGADGYICITTYNEKTPFYVLTGTTVPFTSVTYHTKKEGDIVKYESDCVDWMEFPVPAKWMSSSPRLVNAKMAKGHGHKKGDYPKVTVELRPITEEEAKMKRADDLCNNKEIQPDEKSASVADLVKRYARVLSFSMLVPANMLIDTTPDLKKPVVQAVITQITFGDKKEETKETKKEEDKAVVVVAAGDDIQESPTKKARKSAPARDGKDEDHKHITAVADTPSVNLDEWRAKTS